MYGSELEWKAEENPKYFSNLGPCVLSIIPIFSNASLSLSLTSLFSTVVALGPITKSSVVLGLYNLIFFLSKFAFLLNGIAIAPKTLSGTPGKDLSPANEIPTNLAVTFLGFLKAEPKNVPKLLNAASSLPKIFIDFPAILCKAPASGASAHLAPFL